MSHPRRWLLLAVVLLIASGGLVVAWLFTGAIDARSLEAWVAGLGIWAPVGFVLLYGIATVAMVPGSIFDFAGGALFGPYLGSVLDLMGGSLGAALAFLVGRYLARDWIEIRAGPRLQRIMRSVEQDGWQFVAFLRLVPIFPYTVINYLLGLTRIPFLHYMVASIVFTVPSTVAYTYFGYASREIIAGNTDSIRYALIAFGLLASLIVLPRYYKRLRKG